MRISHIWFDFAGTLYKETPQFNELHDQLRFKTFAKLQGIDDLNQARQEFLALYQKHGSNSAVFQALGQPPDFWMKTLDEMDYASVLYPDPAISKTLLEISRKVPVSLFTNFARQRIDELLKYLDIPAALFTNILSGDDVVERKPALNGFYSIIEHSSVSPAQILYVGDRVDVDIKPAKQLGMQTALLYSKSSEADYCLQRFSDLNQLL